MHAYVLCGRCRKVFVDLLLLFLRQNLSVRFSYNKKRTKIPLFFQAYVSETLLLASNQSFSFQPTHYFRAEKALQLK